MDEATLLSQARAGDQEAMARLVEHHAGPVRRYLARLSPDAEAADDLAQEVFLGFLGSIKSVELQGDLRGYLIGIARNRACSAWRRHYRGREVSGDELFNLLESDASEQHAAAVAEHRLSALRTCMQKLKPKTKDVVIRHYQEQERCQDIAANTKLAVSSVRAVLVRARQALRKCIDFQLGGTSA